MALNQTEKPFRPQGLGRFNGEEFSGFYNPDDLNSIVAALDRLERAKRALHPEDYQEETTSSDDTDI